MEKAFPHNFKNLSPSTPLDVNGVNGYTKCLSHLYLKISELTEFNPAKRMIDAVVLLDIIVATNAELHELMEAEQVRLKQIAPADLQLQTYLS